MKPEDEESIWFSPEKFIYHYWQGAFDAEIIGNVDNFMNYNVHYIGKATEQDIVKRLTGHSHLQDILSEEYPFFYGSLPTDEIAILFFKFYDNIHFNTFGENDSLEYAVDLLLGNNFIEDNTIYLDAEKALINALKPKHNRQLYKNYPVSSDGLQKHELDLFTYSFMDPITLLYTDGKIKGGRFFEGDIITVKDRKNLEVKTKNHNNQSKVKDFTYK